MSGGIIIQRARVLLTAATDPSVYDGLPNNCKDRIDAISQKAPADRTEADVECLASMIVVGVHC